MIKMQILPAEPKDIPIIRSLIEALADYEKLREECIITDEDLNEWLFQTPKAKAVVCWQQGEPVGFALYFNNFSTFKGKPGIYLEDLFVKPEHRGKGYGKALLKYLAKEAVDNGYARFEWSVLDWNQPSIDFYESVGAKLMHEWKICRVDGQELLDLAKP
jgi:GNAT superfamily N-acetyltransferase